MTTSTGAPRASSSGRTSAALPTTPTESARPAARACSASASASSRSAADDVEVAGVEPALHPRRVALDDQRHAAVHRHRQRLGAAHPAEPGGEGERAGQRAAAALARTAANVSYVPCRIPCVPM